MALMKCPECGSEMSEAAKSCPHCGYTIEETKFCKYCGEKVPIDSVVCTKCGRQIEETDKGGIVINNAASSSASASAAATATVPVERPHKKKINKMTALLLCIFLGWVGAHKFYEGKIGMGILYVLTMGLLCIGWIADIIIIAMKPNPYYVELR